MKEFSSFFEYIDLFSGCGGLALGMHNAGWRGLFAIEKNQDAFKTLEHNLINEKEHFLWPKWLPKSAHDIDEILQVHESKLKEMAGSVTLVTGGPPCQGFSSAGRRNEHDERNKLVDSYLKFIDAVRPNSVLFENVKGFGQAFQKKSELGSGKNYSDYIHAELQTRGYLVESRLLDFSHYGIPQRRVRFILFASKVLEPSLFFDALSKYTKHFIEERDLPLTVSIKNAISDIERKHGECDCIYSSGFKVGKYGSSQSIYQRYLRCGARKGEVPDSHRFARHRENTEKRFQELLELNIRDCNISKLLTEKYNIKKNCFRILNADLPAPTITSNPDDYVHYAEPRTLTVREYARIQSFPDWYSFKGNYTTGGKHRRSDVPRYTQIANAIPPLFAEQVGIVLQKLLWNHKEEKVYKKTKE